MRKLIIPFLVTFTLSSCNLGWLDVGSLNRGFELNGRWVLVGGELYVDQRDCANDLTVSNHFADGSNSSLNIDGCNFKYWSILRFEKVASW